MKANFAKNILKILASSLAIFLFILIVLVFFGSCSNPYWFNIKGYKILQEDLGTAWNKVSSYEYKEHDGNLLSPIQFEANGGGQCGDFALDLQYYLGKDATFIVCKMSFSLPGTSHAIIKYHGKYIEPQDFGRYYTPNDGILLYTIQELSYYTMLSYFTNYGTKSIQNSPIQGIKFSKKPVPKEN